MTIDHAHYGDIRDRLVRLPHGDPYGGMSYVRDDLFTVRHELIRKLDPQPTSVFEFGALVGYFLVTALDAAPSIVDVGWVDNESHSPGSNEMCSENVRSVRPDLEDVFWWRDRDFIPSRDPDSGEPQYDLVAVDSDHSYDGALADLRAAHRLNPHTIMVDDWTAGSHGDDIHAAVETFLNEEADDWEGGDGVGAAWGYDLAEYVTVNGLAVLTRKEWA